MKSVPNVPLRPSLKSLADKARTDGPDHIVESIGTFLPAARAAYEEAKVNYNAGRITLERLENVRKSLEAVERAAAKIIATRGQR